MGLTTNIVAACGVYSAVCHYSACIVGWRIHTGNVELSRDRASITITMVIIITIIVITIINMVLIITIIVITIITMVIIIIIIVIIIQ